ncbi:DUF1997 domain-containing protein [Pseudanabaena sp. FACHB-2040]|uniref:DUF1997 domain-containing protein n=1 Tax=Pseudanabaena sp. FACHB-2040 TaxID=2692859 RepID=UPI0016829BBD|nr:DUF1997 domain-containing protein [Pseudanabaena sp. FACHB-2040]MBD2256419.1 DUF1997 domain-containing protein [Pseudanabaena sp. FACHB-2040]
MQSSSTNPYSSSAPDQFIEAVSGIIESSENPHATDGFMNAVAFEGQYVGQMDMTADPATVARYLDVHQEWFKRCAQPMEVEPITENGYALLIGHFGALGYEVDPQIGLHLLPQDQGVYRIETIPIPGYTPPGYDVDFRAALQLKESTNEAALNGIGTQVEWELHLTVKIQFPRFIHSLPGSLVKVSGDRLLNQIVRQVSKRLTRKVQEDFHESLGLPLPQSYHGHHFWSGWGKGQASED